MRAGPMRRTEPRPFQRTRSVPPRETTDAPLSVSPCTKPATTAAHAPGAAAEGLPYGALPNAHRDAQGRLDAAPEHAGPFREKGVALQQGTDPKEGFVIQRGIEKDDRVRAAHGKARGHALPIGRLEGHIHRAGA